jgi:hypothetical protein
MKIGFSILSHQVPDSMLVSLLNQLNRYPEKEIVIHHDFYQADFENDLFKDVQFELVKDYIRTYWSHINNIQAILETLKLLYQKKCDWYITLSANCYPIKSPDNVIKFLEETENDGFMERNNVLTDHFDFYKYFRRGFETKYLFKIPLINRKGKIKYKAIRRYRSTGERLLSESYAPYHGSDWFIVNRKIIEYILSNETKIAEVVKFLEDVNKGPDINVCPAEVVFQTILGNAKLFNLDNYNYRFINWINSKDWHPNTLTLADYNSIQKSDALFARKFNWEKSKDLIELIDRELLQ